MTDPRPEIRFRPNKSPQRVRHGFPWAYDNEIVTDRRTKKIAAGTIVDLLDTDRNFVAQVAFHPTSKIACRVLERDRGVAIGMDWLAAKLSFAKDHRDRLFAEPFYRLIHAEADGLPGLIIDRFGDVLVVQPNAAWIDGLMGELTEAIAQVFGEVTIIKNASGRARGLEGLSEESEVFRGSVDGPIAVPMNGATYLADVLGGQKTGLFFDQRPNHAFAASLAQGADVLDVFSHVGGFSLAALAGGASTALAVDGSAAALGLASEGAAKSGFAAQFDTRKGDAFDVMTALASEGRTFDVVVCDPPAFAPAKPALQAGLRAYEKVARMGAALVRPGGYLVLCSCSHAADVTSFRQASLRGIGKGGRVGQIVHTGYAGADHPVHPNLAESAYLKSLFLRLQ
ncbi:class I SAM-dependent rRNA methyltransferase [Amylibacter sp. IMCC11727]|uniref:RSP_2647 family RNA methyltransferase n=1 Tax=Amylibacter sp. IMCC11727 TaxID=3039851 RepID=UPI00244E20C7|nr:class I SAM-dependent rRNA methyltransferase [Amylibacter sp. IMCC11727]WGI21032.1 class I SAM-dependent rRNA methyltransferase [Amylibacter sp. IMCC11727]